MLIPKHLTLGFPVDVLMNSAERLSKGWPDYVMVRVAAFLLVLSWLDGPGRVRI
jgi:hypothetical protein